MELAELRAASLEECSPTTKPMQKANLSELFAEILVRGLQPRYAGLLGGGAAATLHQQLEALRQAACNFEVQEENTQRTSGTTPAPTTPASRRDADAASDATGCCDEWEERNPNWATLLREDAAAEAARAAADRGRPAQAPVAQQGALGQLALALRPAYPPLPARVPRASRATSEHPRCRDNAPTGKGSSSRSRSAAARRAAEADRAAEARRQRAAEAVGCPTTQQEAMP